MPRVTFAPGEYYHVFNRGVNRQRIFLSERNWGFFLVRLREYFSPDLADIIAYCLMPNHFHLLVLVKCNDFGLKVMQPFATSYTKAVNKEHQRVGPVFQGRFRAIHVDDNSYLVHLTRYIHRNPVDARLVKSAGEWQFSSFLDYVGRRAGTLPKPDIVLGQFVSLSDYAAYVEGTDDGYDMIAHLLLY